MARRRNQGSKWITKERRQGIYERDSRCCVYCGQHEVEINERGDILTLDHILACKHGGTNASANLVTACRSCNSSKEARSNRQFFAVLRARGIDTSAVSRRISRQRRKPVDLTLGKAIVAARKAS